MKILLINFNAKVSTEDILKPTIGNESLHKISNDNGVRVVNFATSNFFLDFNTVYPFVVPFYHFYTFLLYL
jgi:hypothetical protein